MDKDEELFCRKLLAFWHPCIAPGTLYGDDGELQCNACYIDFKRDNIQVIDMIIARLAPVRFKLAMERENAKTI